MSEKLVIIEELGEGVARLTLNRPDKKNALSTALRDAVSDGLDLLARDATLKAMIVTGAGGCFSAGFDLGEFKVAEGDEAFKTRLWESSDRYHWTLLRFPLPLIAAIEGPCLAGGFDTAVLCDLRIAASTARFGHPEISFGDVVYGPLHDLVGGAVARDLCLTGRFFDAAEALALRVVTKVVAPEALQDEAFALARQIAKAPRAPLLRTKAKIQRRAGIAGKDTLDL
ncbi:MAG: enoyl-CoA hydratase/isomerase family protein [Alphaproteobacteria bacterium]|nr:enoyl-CoA hydratase/isomerase family protein [Alphaproteobacteria bacterium]